MPITPVVFPTTGTNPKVSDKAPVEAAINAALAEAAARANHTGTQSADTLTDGATNKAFLATERTKLAGVATGATANDTDVNLRARASHTGTDSLDSTVDSGTRVAMTPAERSKLGGVATGATANDTDVNLKARDNHTGTDSLDSTVDSGTRVAMTPVERTKLAGVATGATANDTDVNLKARANHTGEQAQSTVTGLIDALGVRAQQFAVPRIADAVVMRVTGVGVPVDVETAFVEKGQIMRPQLHVVPRIGQALKADVGAGGVVLAVVGDFGEAVSAFPQGDMTADVGLIEERHSDAPVTGRSLRQAWLRRSTAIYVPLTGGPYQARLLGVEPALGRATVRRGGVTQTVRWRTTPVTPGGTMHMALVLGQSLALGHVDSAVDERRPHWRDPVAERAHQFRDGGGVQRGPRPLQVDPVGTNKAVAIGAGQLAALEPLRGARHAENPQYGQTCAESLALALIGQHLHADDHVLACVIGTGSTAIADFAPATAHYLNAQAAITAARAQALARGLALKVWLIPCQGEEDNSIGTTLAAWKTGWLAIRDGLSAHSVAAGGTFGGTIIQQTLQRPSGVTGMATLAQADLIVAGEAVAVVPQTCQPGYSGSTHLLPLTYLPLGSATAHEMARLLAAPAAISGFVAAAGKGAAFSPRLLRTLSQVDTMGTPLTAVGQAVGRIEGVGYAVPVLFSQVTAGARPALAAGGLIQFDGTTDYLDGGANMLEVSRNTGAVTFHGRVRIGNLTTQQCIWDISAVGSARRLGLLVNTTGSLTLQARRLDAETLAGASTAIGLVAANTTYSVIVVVNYAAGTAQLYLNGGADVLAMTLTSAGQTQDTASLRARLGASVATTPITFFSGALGRFGFANKLPTAGEIAAIFAELALDPGMTLSPHVAPGDAVLVTGTQIDCKITGGSGVYAFDVATMIADAAGTYGVRVENDSGAVAISGIALIGGNTLRLTLGATVLIGSNPRVEFGLFGPEGMTGAAASRVNIRDDSAWTCPCTGQIISGWMLHHRAIVT